MPAGHTPPLSWRPLECRLPLPFFTPPRACLFEVTPGAAGKADEAAAAQLQRPQGRLSSSGGRLFPFSQRLLKVYCGPWHACRLCRFLPQGRVGT